VVNGYVRDTREICRLNYPTFCFGRYGQDSAPRYKVVDFRVPIKVGPVRIAPGDIIYGDIDGVLVVPRDCEEEVFRRALEKARGEKKVANAIKAGMSAVAAFKKYGIM
jgi:regulator of RNase E activity RraA